MFSRFKSNPGNYRSTRKHFGAVQEVTNGLKYLKKRRPWDVSDNEKQKRLLIRAEAVALGRGGITRLAEITGMNRHTAAKGVRV